MKLGRCLPVLVAALLPIQPLQADEWRVDHAASRIGFVATYDEIPFEGKFQRFEARIRFDAGDPAGGSFAATIDIASVDSDSPDRDEGMLEADWFDVGKYPTATFESSAIRKISGSGEYALDGDLTIKNITRPLRATFTWGPADGSARLEGSADVRRGDFDIGSGDWSDDDTIGFDVRVVFDLVLEK